MKKTFVTLFPKVKNDDYYRDPCMIPYIMAKDYGFCGRLVYVKQEEDYSNFEKFMPELELENIKSEDAIYGYIRENAKSIDVLNVFFLSVKQSLKWIEWYKQFNKNGIAYIKLDMNLIQAEAFVFGKSPKNILKRLLVKKKLSSVDMISAETTEVQTLLESFWKRKVLYIPDGYYDFDGGKVENENVEKKKVILTVGHLGTEAKNTELLLDAYAKSSINQEYQLHLVGSRTENLEKFLEQYFLVNGELKERIILEGTVTDRNRLNFIYQSAEVFILPSKWESFGIAMLEAAVHGCFLISTDKVPAFADLVTNECNGMCFESDNKEQLINILNKIPDKLNEFDREELKKKANEFNWPNICLKICEDITNYIPKK